MYKGLGRCIKKDSSEIASKLRQDERNAYIFGKEYSSARNIHSS